MHAIGGPERKKRTQNVAKDAEVLRKSECTWPAPWTNIWDKHERPLLLLSRCCRLLMANTSAELQQLRNDARGTLSQIRTSCIAEEVASLNLAKKGSQISVSHAQASCHVLRPAHIRATDVFEIKSRTPLDKATNMT
eukprot:6208401-Pleurochrysis_carterae.AAC.3